MAKLTVKLRGEQIAQLVLENGNEYIAGRAPDAQIPLANERGISRHHLKFYQKDGVWVCEALSKFVLIHKGGQSTEVVELTEAQSFGVPPYEFYFDPGKEKSEKPAAQASDNLPAFYQPRVGQPAGSPNATTGEHNTGPRANNEATMAGAPAHLIPYFRISYPSTADDEVLKLEGHLWIVGRDHSCEIHVDSANISRRHFELARTKEGFFITDLGSSNGTKINGVKIPPHEPTKIESGDEIQVKNIVMSFEIRDSNFGHRMENLPVPVFDPMLAAPPMPWGGGQLQEMPSAYHTAGDFPTMKSGKAADRKKLMIRGAIGLGAVVVILSQFMPSTPEVKPERTPANTSPTFDKLTQEQRHAVKDSFSLSRNLYVQGKYELCLTELAKMHEVIPQYENSKELMSFCEQGKELLQRQRDADRRAAEREQIEQQISAIVDNCKAKMKDEGTVDETRMCLGEAMELDPEHHLIIEMVHTAQMHEEEKKFLSAQRKAEATKVARGQAHFEKAQNLARAGKLKMAVQEYEKFVSTPYPKSEENKNIARREIASVSGALKVKIDTMLEQCKSLGGKNQYKNAVLACDKALEEDAENPEAKKMRNQMVTELKRELKSVYEDSVLEESLGNVDSAKEKWKKIMKDDLETGEYGQKAKVKLQKYGMGV